MAQYLPITISAILIFTILMWWLLALGSVKKKSGSSTQDLAKDSVPPKAVPAPPVAAAPPTAPKAAVKKTVTAQLMDDPKPTPKSAPPKAQAPLKPAATKAAPTKAPATGAKPAVKTVAVPRAAAAATKTAAKVKVAAVAPAPKPKAAAPNDAPKAAAKPKAAKVAIPDNLELLKGVGPKVNNMLKGLGITSFAQVASWTAADITEIDAKLGAFAGRINRDNWVDQAKLLVAGDVAGFEKKYGSLGSEIGKS
jgi:predicted flap endonuclease-1-like 5' DNA nuclease